MKSNYKRAKIAIVLIWMSLVIDAISAFSSYMQIKLLQSMNNGEEYDMSVLQANDNREQIVGIVAIIIALISAIGFLMWFSRASDNLHSKIKDLSFSQNAAIWTWFVPIVNLFRPSSIMKEMFKKTSIYIKEAGHVTENIDLSINKISIWWTLWIISSLTGQIIFRLSRHADDIDSLLMVSWLQVLSFVISVPLCFYTVKVIKSYSKAEEILIRI